MDFGTQLRMMRAYRNMSQADLAERAGVIKHTISAIESGAVDPGPELAARIRDALAWPAEATAAFAMLAGGNGQPTPCSAQ